MQELLRVRSSRQQRGAVIGAGAAGLVTARELLKEGHQVTVFEQNDSIGGIWNYQEECEEDDLLGRDPKRRHVHSSMYSTLRTNLPRQIMSYSDFPFIPEVMGDKSHDSRRFPAHTEVLAWLDVFATTFDLHKHIRLSTKVASLRPLVSGDTMSTDDAAAESPRWQLRHCKVSHKNREQSSSQTKAAVSQRASQPAEQVQSLPAHGTAQHKQIPVQQSGADLCNSLSLHRVEAIQQAESGDHNSGTDASNQGCIDDAAQPKHSGKANAASDAPQHQQQHRQQNDSALNVDGIVVQNAPCEGHEHQQPQDVSASQFICSIDPAAVPDTQQQHDASVPQCDGSTDPDGASHAHQDQQQHMHNCAPATQLNGSTESAAASDTQQLAHEQQQEQTDVFDAVVCCVGNYHQPNLPVVDGIDSFPGFQMHAHNYRTNAMFAGKRVMVIGSSFSGEEIARLVANVAAQVFHSARSFAKQATPRSNLARVAMLVKLDSNGTATLQDGSELQHIDAVVYCTGYQYAYPFLEGTNLIKSHDMRVDPLWMHIFPPAVAPTLAFVGLLWKSLRNWQFQLQAKLVARVLSGKSQLPHQGQMQRDIDAFYQLLQDSSVPVRYTHDQEDSMPVDQFVYNAELARLCGPGARTHPDWIKALYVKHVGGNILRKPDSFRDTWDDVELETFALLDELCAEMLSDLRQLDGSSQAMS